MLRSRAHNGVFTSSSSKSTARPSTDLFLNVGSLRLEHPLDIGPRTIFSSIRHLAVQSKGENRSSLRSTGEGADCIWDVSSGRIGKSGLIQNTLTQLHAVSNVVERPSKTGRPWTTRCEYHRNHSVMIITLQSTIPASDLKRRYAAWEKRLRELGFAHPSPPSRFAKRRCCLESMSGELCDIW